MNSPDLSWKGANRRSRVVFFRLATPDSRPFEPLSVGPKRTPTDAPRPSRVNLRAAFITVGDTSRLTGGYLYHSRVFARLGDYGIEVEEVVPSGASADEQRAGVPNLAAFDPRGYDVVVVDALARVVCAPFIEEWQEEKRPVVAMVHELPSLAAPEGDAERERGFEEALLGADMFIAASRHGQSVLEGRGVPSGRIRIASPGFDGLAATTAAGRSRAARETDSDTARRGASPRSEIPERASRRDSPSMSGDPAPSGMGHARQKQGSSTEARVAGSPESSDALRALCVAQWIERKGVLDLIEAWKMADAPNASLHLVGDTDADPEYRSRVMSAIGEDPSIKVSGTLDDESLAAACSESDFFVLPSHYEGYGIVYAEALSFGLPVVACRVGPVPELVGEEAALLVPPRDIEGLAHEIHRILSDSELRLRMSEAALRRAEKLPRWEDTTRDFAEVLKEAIARG